MSHEERRLSLDPLRISDALALVSAGGVGTEYSTAGATFGISINNSSSCCASIAPQVSPLHLQRETKNCSVYR